MRLSLYLYTVASAINSEWPRSRGGDIFCLGCLALSCGRHFPCSRPRMYAEHYKYRTQQTYCGGLGGILSRGVTSGKGAAHDIQYCLLGGSIRC